MVNNFRFKQAFTLVELLVAVAVIAVGMVFVLGSFSQCMSGAGTARNMETAGYLLNAKLWEIDEARKVANATEEDFISGEFAAPYQSFNWSDTLSTITSDFGNESLVVRGNLTEETIKVSWKQGKTVKDVSVVRYIKKKIEI